MTLSGQGTLAVTLETDDLAQRYQGVVPLEGAHLAECLQGYFENSEQLPTRLWLNADRNGVSGMLLQRLPNESMSQRAETGSLRHDVDDAWQRVQMIGDTLKPEELHALTDRQILHRLFNEDDVRLFESSPVSFRCRCSHERVSTMLQSLGEAEIASILEERGNVEVHCDFCNRAYVFDAIDAARLFAPGAPGSSSRVH
jgi:molecular chaperone Hsp33